MKSDALARTVRPPMRGFTLLEVLVVLSIISLLAALAVPRYVERLEEAREAVLAENLKVVRIAIDRFSADTGRYPGSLAELVERRPGDIALNDIGLDVARRAEHILASTRDLVDFARHRDVLSGPLTLGIIPTLAPFILPTSELLVCAVSVQLLQRSQTPKSHATCRSGIMCYGQVVAWRQSTLPC